MASSSAATASSSSSSPSASSLPQDAAQACLQVLQAAAALLPMHVKGLSQLVRKEKIQGRDEDATATHILQTLRAALDEVLGDGAGKRKRADPDQDNKITENQPAAVPIPDASTISATIVIGSASTTIALPSSACARVFHTEQLLISIIGWLFHERHTSASRVALGQAALVSKESLRISRQTCFWRPLLEELLPVVGANDESVGAAPRI